MTTQEILLYIDIPDGYEFVEFRKVRTRELYLGDSGSVVEWQYASPSGGSRFILREKWVWPTWLTAPWIAKDQNGNWWAFDLEPVFSTESDCWIANSKVWPIATQCFDFYPPTCGSFRDSKRPNPNLEMP